MRLALGSATVLLFTGVGVLAIALDLPQMLWGAFVNSGFTEPFPVCRPRLLYALAVACPSLQGANRRRMLHAECRGRLEFSLIGCEEA